MKVNVRSLGSATIVNAIAIGKGSAFGIDLDILTKSKSITSGIKCSSDIGADTTLMELSAKKVIDYYNVDFGVEISTKSNLPMASGLSSSSALSNAVCKSIAILISEEFDLKVISDIEIINLAINASLDAGVTVTGAFDDATASYFGGVTVTDNISRKIIIKEDFENYNILIYMPNKGAMTSNSDVNRMKLLSPLVKMGYNLALKRDYLNAMNLNGLLYSSTLGFDSEIAIDALNSGALASGLSGTGSSFVAICNDDKIDDVKDAWSSYSGRIIETKVNNIGTTVL
ncbi:shikimate kinase [Methanobrevibacter filiformis]|uniref:Shikimate kinase n=1 Tax=Methanobrevibacter filiformis TaxID=55758 RepID=A0A166F9N0_9EURY|nr:shikimate kinase [Methanobrevibacter filiformis]KZX17443.1 homoserine kinase [Methanobrevibacter filiformis]